MSGIRFAALVSILVMAAMPVGAGNARPKSSGGFTTFVAPNCSTEEGGSTMETRVTCRFKVKSTYSVIVLGRVSGNTGQSSSPGIPSGYEASVSSKEDGKSWKLCRTRKDVARRPPTNLEVEVLCAFAVDGEPPRYYDLEFLAKAVGTADQKPIVDLQMIPAFQHSSYGPAQKP